MDIEKEFIKNDSMSLIYYKIINNKFVVVLVPERIPNSWQLFARNFKENNDKPIHSLPFSILLTNILKLKDYKEMGFEKELMDFYNAKDDGNFNNIQMSFVEKFVNKIKCVGAKYVVIDAIFPCSVCGDYDKYNAIVPKYDEYRCWKHCQ